VFVENGKVCRVSIPPLVTSNSFAAGHRIRVEVSSSSFPHFDRRQGIEHGRAPYSPYGIQMFFTCVARRMNSLPSP
jgi:predicted acyl esterase